MSITMIGHAKCRNFLSNYLNVKNKNLMKYSIGRKICPLYKKNSPCKINVQQHQAKNRIVPKKEILHPRCGNKNKKDTL